MIDNDDIDNLPNDPMLAFVVMANLLDEQASEHDASSEGIGFNAANRCAEDIYAFIDAHDLDEQFPRLSPRQPRDNEAFWVWWPDFVASVRYYRTRILIARRSHPSMVVLTENHKQRIHTLLDQIREIVPKLNLNVEKHDAVMARINALAAEVDKLRTNAEAAVALWLQICSAVGKGAEKLKPVAELLEKINKALGEAKSEEPPQLPGPTNPKQIEPPRKQIPSRSNDDDIPF